MARSPALRTYPIAHPCTSPSLIPIPPLPAASAHRQLQVLRLGWNMLGPKGGKALAEGLKYCSSGLEQLYLPWSGITDTGASHIAKVGLAPPMLVCMTSLACRQFSIEHRILCGFDAVSTLPAETCRRLC